MNGYSTGQVWLIILGLAVGTYLIRFSFLGLYGRMRPSRLAMRLLRYTPVAVLPGLVAPLVLWPQANGGHMEPARLTAALVALVFGAVTRNTLAAIVSGGAALYAMLYFLG